VLQATEICGLGAVLESQEQELLLKAKEDPVRALRELRGKWDTLMTTSTPDQLAELGFKDAYQKFSIWYEGVTTVPASYEELKKGQMRFMLQAYVSDYYEKKRLQLGALRTAEQQAEPAPAPVAPATPAPAAPAPESDKVPTGVLVGAAGFFGLLLWAMMRKP
jgi:hypothetical protein